MFDIFKIFESEIRPQIEGQDVVAVVGNTGDGKSTLVASVVFGPDALNSIPRKDIQQQV